MYERLLSHDIIRLTMDYLDQEFFEVGAEVMQFGAKSMGWGLKSLFLTLLWSPVWFHFEMTAEMERAIQLSKRSSEAQFFSIGSVGKSCMRLSIQPKAGDRSICAQQTVQKRLRNI